MEERVMYDKKLCMTELQVEHTVFSRLNYFEAVEGRVTSSFLFIICGSLTLTTMGQRLTADAGSLLYIPEGQRYNAVWQGSFSAALQKDAAPIPDAPCTDVACRVHLKISSHPFCIISKWMRFNIHKQ